MSFKKIAIFIGAIALLMVSILFMSDDIMTPYVSVAEAQKKAGKLVQVIGKLDGAKPVAHTEKNFTFSILDDANTSLDIVYAGTKPMNFDRADQIVSIGRFDTAKNAFMAEKLLVKCPSKYEEQYKDRAGK